MLEIKKKQRKYIGIFELPADVVPSKKVKLSIDDVITDMEIQRLPGKYKEPKRLANRDHPQYITGLTDGFYRGWNEFWKYIMGED